jgi:hypothetical protein
MAGLMVLTTTSEGANSPVEGKTKPGVSARRVCVSGGEKRER